MASAVDQLNAMFGKFEMFPPASVTPELMGVLKAIVAAVNEVGGGQKGFLANQDVLGTKDVLKE